MEHLTIKELIQIVRSKTDFSKISETEFENFIIERRPLELILMAQSFTNLGSES